MPTSSQITAKANAQPNPEAWEAKLYEKSRYLVAQKPASSVSVTKDGFYEGKVVIPGPKANPKLSAVPANTNYLLLKQVHYIRITDDKTTQDADSSVGMSLYTVMTDEQADHYEAELKKLRK